MTSAIKNLVRNQFPQPTRPPNSYDMSFEVASTAYPQNREDIGLDPQQSLDHSHKPPMMTKEEEAERKFDPADKLVNHILEKYQKLPASIRDQINLEEILAKERNRLRKISGEAKSQASANSRGLQEPVEEGSSEKLERFKIRTVVVEETVEGDEKK